MRRKKEGVRRKFAHEFHIQRERMIVEKLKNDVENYIAGYLCFWSMWRRVSADVAKSGVTNGHGTVYKEAGTVGLTD